MLGVLERLMKRKKKKEKASTKWARWGDRVSAWLCPWCFRCARVNDPHSALAAPGESPRNNILQ